MSPLATPYFVFFVAVTDKVQLLEGAFEALL